MKSWREDASQQAQDDLDGLLGAVLPFAEQTIARYGEMFPFGATIDVEGTTAMVAADSGLGEQSLSNDVLAFLYEGASSRANSLRAAAFVADVRMSGSDAVRVELEHAEGTALVVFAPYTRSRLTKKVRVGALSVNAGMPRTWA